LHHMLAVATLLSSWEVNLPQGSPNWAWPNDQSFSTYT
jgi:hypothetical protein